MDLKQYYDEWVRIEDVRGNIIKCYVFDYDSGDEEEEDSPYYNVPNITVENVEVIKGTDYWKSSKILYYADDIISIEIIK